MNKVITLILITVTFSSCSVLKEKHPTNFTKKQAAYILSESENVPMRLFLITHKEDSILLRQKSEDIKYFQKDTVLQHFVKRLYATVTDSTNAGVGIAAPQVGILKNVIWVQRFDKPNYPFEVYFNPKILYYSQKKRPCPEGCLSIPNKTATTLDRSFTIQIQYKDQYGNEQIEIIKDFTSVVFQHEIDHLNGILFIDHLLQEENRGDKAY